MAWFGQAPANIALIKYMGKRDTQQNLPMNPSLSYTLDQLLSHVELECHAGPDDRWEPLQNTTMPTLALSTMGQQRFLNHLAWLKGLYHCQQPFIVRSANNFPQGTGLASSASSFAALTTCALQALSDLTGQPLPSKEKQAALSRHGSGSSCRSFFAPWAQWDGEQVFAVNLPYQHLHHQVILVSDQEKAVSSSMAHQLVPSSPHYENRHQRAKDRLEALTAALQEKQWQRAYELTWQEFQDMHALFATASPGFSYLTDDSRIILNLLQKNWERHGDGPLITMDAGPNIHLLYREDQMELAQQFKHDYLTGHYDVR